MRCPVLSFAIASALAASSLSTLANTDVFINEFHYDNASTDVGEFVEVAGPPGTSLDGWSIALYNGSSTQRSVYITEPLAGVLEDSCDGLGALSFLISGIQNGAPDGFALVDPGGTAVQFLSYEGSFTAASGPAQGMTSTNVGVVESSSTAVGQSLQLVGAGQTAEDFNWAGPDAESPGTCNTGQTVGAPGLSVSLSSPDNGATDVPINTPVEVEFNLAVTDTEGAFGLRCDDLVQALTPTRIGQTRFALGNGELPAGSTCEVTVSASLVESASGPLSSDFVASFSTAADPGQCNDDAAFISEIQGSGLATPLPLGEGVIIEGIVVGDYQGADALGGFFVQEEDADADADPATSEGIFVFDPTTMLDVNEGDVVRVAGKVAEFFDMTQVSNVTSVQLCATGVAATPASISLPAAGPTFDPNQDGSTNAATGTFENVEGMLVEFTDELTVSEYFQLARFGQLVLSANGRPRQFTDVNTPDVAGFAAFNADLARNRIILDDLVNRQNPDLIYHPQPDFFSATSFVRGGDTVAALRGVMHWSFSGAGNTNGWRIRPQISDPVIFEPGTPRTASPDDVGGTLKVAAFNVLNYFTTIDDGNPACGPDGSLDCRGANSVVELERQTDKIVAALLEIDADVVGLIEVENDAGASVMALVDALNDELGPGTYDFVDTGFIGTDAIKVAFIFRPEAVDTVGDFAVLDASLDPAFIDTKNRPALVQTFAATDSGEIFTAAVNHLKSKGSPCDDVDDPGLGDGQANCNLTRTAAAQALVNYLATDPTGSGDPDFMIIGDLNAYAMEDPIAAIEDAGYVNLIEAFSGEQAYSFVFDGQLGYLDHALASASLSEQVSGVTEWHINADEVNLLDYNDGVRDDGEPSFAVKPAGNSDGQPLFAADPYRASDHDPLIVGLALAPPPPVVPSCNGLAATIYVDEDQRVVGGPQNGRRFFGLLFGTRGNDVIVASDRGDLVVAGGGSDTVCGQGGNDLVFGGRGPDFLDGGDGRDGLFGGRGRDTCVNGERVSSCRR